MSYAEAVQRLEGTSKMGQVREESNNGGRANRREKIKMLLAFMVEAMWRVKTVASKKSDVA